MKTHLYLIAAMSTSTIFAQTLTQSANAPAPGNTNNRKGADTTATLPNNTTGSGVTWNMTLSITTNTRVFSENWVNPSTLPGTSAFVSAGANVCRSDSTLFMKSSSTQLEYLGDMFPNGSVTQFTNSAKVMQYSFSLNNSFTDNFSGFMNVSGLGTLNVSGNLTVTADGQGTLILPTNPSPTSYTVLRVKTQVNMTATGTGTISFITGTINTITYDYYKTGMKFPLISYNYQTTNVPAMGINNQKDFNMDYDASLVLDVNTLNANTPYVFIYPNPTSDILNVETNTNKPYTIELFNLQGQSVFHKTLEPHTPIDTKFLSSGAYIILIKDETNTLMYSGRFIKE